MTREFAVQRLDVIRFALQGGQLEWEGPVAHYPRLAAESVEGGAQLPVRWIARAELRDPEHANPRAWLHIDVNASVALVCQRCLAPVEVPVHVDRWFRFVADEKVALAEDDESEEDLLALSAAFDLDELIEDELLMALPVVPRHKACTQPMLTPASGLPADEAAAARPHPFAVLQQLKRGK